MSGIYYKQLISVLSTSSSVTSQQLKRKGATLVFTVMDHDYVFQNDFAGEAYMDLAEVPGATGEMITGWDALNIVSLKLMHPKPKGKDFSHYHLLPFE